MSLQIIKNTRGTPEYVLLPVRAYQKLKTEIDRAIKESEEYVPFMLEDYIENPVSLARINADLTQEELASRMGVSQAYISKLENQKKVGPKTMDKVIKACQTRGC